MSTTTTTWQQRSDTAYKLLADFSDWWDEAPRPARGLAAGVLGAAGGAVLLIVWALVNLVEWLARGAAHLIGHHGVHALAAWQITHVITDPIRHYIGAAHLPASASALSILWLVAAIILWLGSSLLGFNGARVGWIAYGAATTAMVYAGTPAAGRGVAAAVTVVAWALLSIPAFWGKSRDVLNYIDVHNPLKAADTPAPTEDLSVGAYNHFRKDVVSTWERKVATSSGALPDARLVDVVVENEDRWTATVRLGDGQSISEAMDATPAIAEAYGLATGSIRVTSGISSATVIVTAFPSPAGADYAERCPIIPLTGDGEYLGESSPAGQLTRLEHAHVADWASKYANSWQAMRTGDRVDVERYWRRLTRLRGGILDAVPHAGPGELAEILTERGLSFAALPTELAEAAGLNRRKTD